MIGFNMPYADIPEIEGTVNVGENILADATKTMSEAIVVAESESGGTAIRANLGIQNGFLVYTVTILSDDGMQIVVVDAGNGKALHVSDPLPNDAISILNSGSHKMIFKSAPNMVIKGMDTNKLTEEE